MTRPRQPAFMRQPAPGRWQAAADRIQTEFIRDAIDEAVTRAERNHLDHAIWAAATWGERGASDLPDFGAWFMPMRYWS